MQLFAASIFLVWKTSYLKYIQYFRFLENNASYLKIFTPRVHSMYTKSIVSIILIHFNNNKIAIDFIFFSAYLKFPHCITNCIEETIKELKDMHLSINP